MTTSSMNSEIMRPILRGYLEEQWQRVFDFAILADGLTSAALNYYVRVISSTADNLVTMFHDQFGGRFLYMT